MIKKKFSNTNDKHKFSRVKCRDANEHPAIARLPQSSNIGFYEIR